MYSSADKPRGLCIIALLYGIYIRHMLDIKFMKTNNEMLSTIFIYGVRKRFSFSAFFHHTLAR